MKYIKPFIGQISEERYYHGTVLPKNNTTIDKFKSSKGLRSTFGVPYEVRSDWTFFTKDRSEALRYSGAKSEIYYSKGDFSHKGIVLEYEIDETDLKILDLTIEDSDKDADIWEFKLQSLGINLIDIYGIGMYDIYSMWELLDEKEPSDKILNEGFNAVKLLEDNDSESLAVHISIVNDVIKSK